MCINIPVSSRLTVCKNLYSQSARCREFPYVLEFTLLFLETGIIIFVVYRKIVRTFCERGLLARGF